MKWILTLSDEMTELYKQKGFNQIGTTTIGGKQIPIFENQKGIELDSYMKYGEVCWTNRITSMDRLGKEEQAIGGEDS